MPDQSVVARAFGMGYAAYAFITATASIILRVVGIEWPAAPAATAAIVFSALAVVWHRRLGPLDLSIGRQALAGLVTLLLTATSFVVGTLPSDIVPWIYALGVVPVWLILLGAVISAPSRRQ